MSGETYITVMGNVVADPELRHTSAGQAVCSFRVASTPRFQRDGKWQDGDPMFLACNVWRALAERAAEVLRKGDPVMVYGRLKQRSFENREGTRQTVYELDVTDVARSLRGNDSRDDRPRDRASRAAPRRDFADEPPF